MARGLANIIDRRIKQNNNKKTIIFKRGVFLFFFFVVTRNSCLTQIAAETLYGFYKRIIYLRFN